MNYVVLGSIIIGLSTLMIRNEAIWTGLVLIAAVPPQVAIIPFNGILQGNQTLSLFGTIGAHPGGLVITHQIALSLPGAASFDQYKLMMTLLMLIFLPLIVSGMLIRKEIKEQVTPYLGTITK